MCLLPTGDEADHVPQPNSPNGPIRLLPLTPSFPICVSRCGPGSLRGPTDRLDAHAMDLVCTSLVSRGALNSSMTIPGGAPPRWGIPITHHRRRTARSQCCCRACFQPRPIVKRSTSISLVLPFPFLSPCIVSAGYTL